MGCNSSKAFKEKDSGFDIDDKSPTFIDTQPTSTNLPNPKKEQTPPPPPKKPAIAKKHNSAGQTSLSDTNTYLVPGLNPAMNPIYFPTPTVVSGPWHNEGCHNSGGGGYSGGCDSGGGGYSGGCDSGGGFSSSSF